MSAARAPVPSEMRAVRLHPPGGLERLAYESVETPSPGLGEVLVRVHAAAITRDELTWPIDRLPAIPSYEVSGVIVGGASDREGSSLGDPVFALLGFDKDGAAAEYAVVPDACIAPRPRSFGHVESAAIPLAGLSAWQGLFDHGRLTDGQRVLVHGASGGVGGFAVQLARNRGAHVIGTASTNGLDIVRELGAHEVIDHTKSRFEDVIDEVDLVFDTVGGDRLARSPAVVRPNGRLVSVASEPPVDVATNRGITSVYFVVEPRRDQLVQLARLADEGELRPTIDRVFALADARRAFERSLARQGRGKIVLEVADE
jgi:NADPH:quinone reductase-like Zn-dependent oxidoreductase